MAGPSFEYAGDAARGIVPATKRTGYTESRVVFLERATITIQPGSDDSTHATSALVTSPTTVNGWIPTQPRWEELLTCLREVWSPFQVEITDLDPGGLPHITAVLGGTPQQLGLPADTAGAAPFAQDCGVVENAMVFAFVPSLKTRSIQQSCLLISQQVATAYGLDHVTSLDDVMSVHDATHKTFTDVVADCGTDWERPCGASAYPSCRSSQNAMQLLYARVGKYIVDEDPPLVRITAPAHGSTVVPGFVVDAIATDRDPIEVGILEIDAQVVAMIEGPGPYEFDPGSLSEGQHVLTFIATDGEGISEVSHTIHVTQPGRSAGCSATGAPAGLVVGLALGALRRRRRRHLHTRGIRPKYRS